ncbi:BatA and WFA domain-containing protein [bacterium]|nr:BatA and WFA domain-containing protein [bacterium]
MTFLNFGLLFGLLAGLIPILIHLLNKQKLKVIDFSNVEFLKILQKQKMRKVKVKQWLLLALRTLIVLLFVTAFARPTLEGYLGTGIESHAKTSVVLVLDNSLSSATKINGEKVIDKIKNKAKQILSYLKKGDDVQIVLANKKMDFLPKNPTHNFEKLASELELVKPSDTNANLKEAILQAFELLNQSKNLNKEVYVLSDLQQNSFSEKLKVDENIKLFFLPFASSDKNLSVSNVILDSQILTKGKKIKVSAKINNFSSDEVSEVFTQIFVNNQRVGHQTVNVGKNSDSQVEFLLNIENSGIHEGFIEIPDDNLLEDNKVFFSFEVPEQAKILAVSGTPNEKIDFLKIFLLASENQTGIFSEVISHDLINSENFSGYNTIILSNVPEISVSIKSKISAFVENGGGLMIFLGDKVDIKNYNNGLFSEFNLPKILNPLGNVQQFDSYLTLTEIAFNHPIFEGVFDKAKPEIDSPKFFYAYRLESKVSNDQVLKFSNSDTFLEEVNFGKGKVFVFASALDLSWTDFPVKGIFPPLLSKSISYLSFYKGSEKIAYEVDEVLNFVGTFAGVQDKAKIEIPSGKQVQANPVFKGNEVKISFSQVEEKGFYKFFLSEKVVKSFAVNSVSSESNLKFFTENELKEKVEGEFFVIDENKEIAEEILQSRYGFELWKYVLILVLALLVAETLIGKAAKFETVKK